MTIITLYTKAGCPGCRMSKRFLDSKSISYESVDVTQDQSALDTIRELGYAALPVVVVSKNDTAVDHWTGYQPDRLGALA